MLTIIKDEQRSRKKRNVLLMSYSVDCFRKATYRGRFFRYCTMEITIKMLLHEPFSGSKIKNNPFRLQIDFT